MLVRVRSACLLAAVTFVGCTTDDSGESPDGIDEVGATTGKADGSALTDCEKTELVGYLNEGVSADALREAGVHTRAATNLVAHRDGADGMSGTADDDLFDSVEEVDAVSYVGPSAFGALVAAVEGRCAPREMQGTCSVTAKHFVNGYANPYTSTEAIALTIRLDPETAQPVGGQDPLPVTGTVQVSSPWDSIPGGLWRGWCHLARRDSQPLDQACPIGAFEIATGALGFGGGYSFFRHGTDGYTLAIGASVESGRSTYFDDDFTETDYSCSLK